MRQPVFPRSGVLVLAGDSVQSLVPSTIISQVESLLDSHRIEDAVDLADQRRKKLEGMISVDEDEADELRYVYQRIGFQCFSETLFEDAGKNLFNGELNPRLLVSYFPDLRGSMFSTQDTTDVFAGVAERMPIEASVDDVIRNYSPHLSPNTRSAPPTAELRKILGMAAKEMLLQFLAKCRMRRHLSASGPGKSNHVADRVVDTVLAKLYAEYEKTKELYKLLQEPHDIVLEEVEPVFQANGQYNALCILYKQRGDDEKLLHTWSKLVEGDWTDDEITNPLSDMISLLTEKRDKPLTHKWGLWLTQRDPEQGLKLLMSRDTGKRKERPEEDIALLEQIENANPTAGVVYLEYLVLQKRSMSRELHIRLAACCIGDLLASVKDDSVSKLWRAKASSYASSNNDSSFLSYFASTTPTSEHKRVRLKTILFLAGSSLYDPEVVLQRISEHEKILRLEFAILHGKLGKHRLALSTLVYDLRDASSAEAYCNLGGDIVPARIAQSVAEGAGLQQWANALFLLACPPKIGAAKTASQPMVRQKTISESLKKDLLNILLEVYMNDEQSSAHRAARLLDSQAMSLDILDVISLVPPKWPLMAMSSFLARSFRRTTHGRQEGKIIKNISAGQNLEVKDRTWGILREEGAIVEEAVEGDDEDGVYDEKVALAEKVAVHLAAAEMPSDVNQEVEKGRLVLRHDVDDPGQDLR